MRRVHLNGKYNPSSTDIKELPDYYFLPAPTHVETDYPEVPNYSIIKKGEFIHWDVTWVGKKNCDKVLIVAKKNLDDWVQVNNVYKKIENTIGKKEFTKDLIKGSNERINHWRSVVNEIMKQTKD